jgi:phospholipase C
MVGKNIGNLLNSMDHSISDQSSILRFIEDNWFLGRTGDQSFDSKASSFENMFDFTSKDSHVNKLFLDPSTGLQIRRIP